ncbi:MAG: hypothetical protein KF832_31115 [Caldilineaceae bacterium]|nr:hypothetical protein [Caldilineaceae bacterium]
MATPTLSEVQNLAINAYNWVAARLHVTPDGASMSEQMSISMYPAIPLTIKVPAGYTVPGADHGDCDYIYHCGNQNQDGSPQMTLTSLLRTEYESITHVSVGPWADGQPNLAFQVNYWVDPGNPAQASINVYWWGKPAGDTRGYPIQAYWRRFQLFSDHRTAPATWIYSTTDAASSPGVQCNGNKYFIRTEDLLAMRLIEEPNKTKAREWVKRQWPNTALQMDIHAPLFKRALTHSDDFMFAWPSFTYHDCTVTHNGCANGWIKDNVRGQADGWGFSHRSKVCTWPTLYVTVLRQDALGLLAQAIHILNKYNNPWYGYPNPWPSGVPGGPSGSTVTPASIADFVWNKWYRSGVGITMFQVPVVGRDQRASSLRTNQMLILATLLGYRYLLSGWSAKADEIAGILRETAVGGPGQPAYGCYSASGARIRRPKFFGSQMFVWDVVSSFGVTSFSWLREAINDYFGLPEDDSDHILSTVETTATFSQAWRVYGRHKYGWTLGDTTNIPGT